MHWLKVACILIALSVAPLKAATADQKYIDLYNLIQEGDTLRQNGQGEAARQRYTEAQAGLRELQKTSPGWNRNIIEFRLRYLQERLGPATPAPVQQAPLTPAPAVRPAPTPSPATPANAAPTAPDQRDLQLRQLQQALAEAQSQNATLNEKLKEALSLQPATTDPRELARAQEQIRSLEKEKDLLTVSLDQERAKKVDPAALEGAQKRAEALQAELARQTEGNQLLAKELEQLKAQLANASKEQPETRDLARAQKEAEELRALAEKREASLRAAEADLKAVRSELAKAKSDDAPKRIAKLEKENAALAERVDKLRADLRKRGRDPEASPEQLAALRARIEVLEATKAPYTPEELALMRAPETPVVKMETVSAASNNSNSNRSRTPELPAGAGALVREAQQAFSARRLKEAEEKYIEVLKLDERNVYSLANVAAIQMELERYDEATQHLKRAIEIEANDAYTHMLMGIIAFRQEKYDDALDSLSRAAQLDPLNAETQNYLGITLSQKGQRGPAEAALRKALQLSPNNPGAHHNLAIIYVSQEPPFVELAKFHYQKALSTGHPKNSDLEKMIEAAEKK